MKRFHSSNLNVVTKYLSEKSSNLSTSLFPSNLGAWISRLFRKLYYCRKIRITSHWPSCSRSLLWGPAPVYCHFDRPPYQSTATTESPCVQKCFSLSSFVNFHLHTHVRNIVVVFTCRWNHLPTFKVNQLELPILSTTYLAGCTYEYLKSTSWSYFGVINKLLRYGRFFYFH